MKFCDRCAGIHYKGEKVCYCQCHETNPRILQKNWIQEGRK